MEGVDVVVVVVTDLSPSCEGQVFHWALSQSVLTRASHEQLQSEMYQTDGNCGYQPPLYKYSTYQDSKSSKLEPPGETVGTTDH